uniref:PUB domain-containing protein n=1 Tax=Proboscia inermis TaxID=420281 RepID=A0A7S0CMZ9_9STRA|eukprot:CAMPEP_0171300106 /NCGR_PEP_ID=MMETSP0816-20121228/8929_1 /TAXON_ID=420281 /ORGANISM="Proboscia inermis, Strain CCAP1064/1" /LENGTH=242 /DNA_ID=CAMNT_0011776387 /DNA_START=78 /DNA_END=806 /DNA_ORIENTATION=+
MSSYTTNAPGMHLQDLILDTNTTVSNKQKVDCLKLLKVVIKNLADPSKANDPKYRQLRLSNEKVHAKLLPCPSGISYMKAIGFIEITDASDGSQYLRIPETSNVNVGHMKAALSELTNAIEIIAPSATSAAKISKQNQPCIDADSGEEKKTPEGIIIRKLVPSTQYATSGKMTELQKTRLLMEKKRQHEAKELKKDRAKNVSMLKQDKYVRENDENWTSGLSAACAKSGSSIETFRDRHGES